MDDTFTAEVEGDVFVGGKRLKMSTGANESSPTGFSWGYSGSAPFALAHSILTHLYDIRVADQWANRFKADVISKMDPDQPLELSAQDVRDWVEKKINPVSE